MKNRKIGSRFFTALCALVLFSNGAAADEGLRYDRTFDIQAPQKPAPKPVWTVDLSEEKAMFKKLTQHVLTPIQPSLGSETEPQISE